MKSVRLIVIEIHSYCNRTCWFCPNSFLDRKHKTKMKEWVYLKILQELKDIEYDGVISFSTIDEIAFDCSVVGYIRGVGISLMESLNSVKHMVLNSGYLEPTKEGIVKFMGSFKTTGDTI